MRQPISFSGFSCIYFVPISSFVRNLNTYTIENNHGGFIVFELHPGKIVDVAAVGRYIKQRPKRASGSAEGARSA